MLVAWVVKIVKSCCTNSTSSLVSAQPARGKLLPHNLIHSFSVFCPQLEPGLWLCNSVAYGQTINSSFEKISCSLVLVRQAYCIEAES